MKTFLLTLTWCSAIKCPWSDSSTHQRRRVWIPNDLGSLVTKMHVWKPCFSWCVHQLTWKTQSLPDLSFLIWLSSWRCERHRCVPQVTPVFAAGEDLWGIHLIWPDTLRGSFSDHCSGQVAGRADEGRQRRRACRWRLQCGLRFRLESCFIFTTEVTCLECCRMLC